MLQDLRIKAVSMSGTDIARISIALIIIIVLLRLAYTLETQLPVIEPRFSQGGLLTASIVHIVAIFIAYNSLLPLATTLLRQDDWVFQVVFLLLLCVPLFRGGKAFYKGIDDIIKFWTNRLGESSDNITSCSICGYENELFAEFCSGCGSKLEKSTNPEVTTCKQCGVENESGAKFCLKCGASLLSNTDGKKNICDQCNAENKSKAKFCTECGTPFADS